MSNYFKNWVDRMCKSFAVAKNYRYYVFDDIRTTIVFNIRTGKSGISRCHYKDTFSPDIGVAIAYARCIGKPVPPDFSYMPYKKKK